MAERNQIRRIGRPREIGKAVVFLASDASSRLHRQNSQPPALTWSLAPTTYNYAMASVASGCEQARQAQDVRLVVDKIPTLAWSARSDGSADFFNQRWLRSARIVEEARL
jgi:hypothetical protein